MTAYLNIANILAASPEPVTNIEAASSATQARQSMFIMGYLTCLAFKLGFTVEQINAKRREWHAQARGPRKASNVPDRVTMKFMLMWVQAEIDKLPDR